MNFSIPNNFGAFHDVDALVRLIRTQVEVIVYPAGKVGERFLEYLMYSGALGSVCCIATKETKGDNTELKIFESLRAYQSRPILPLEMLVHFAKTALFIVVAPSSRQDEMHEELKAFGCEKIIFIDEQVHTLIERKLKQWQTAGLPNNLFMSDFNTKLNEMEYMIAEQNEISSTHTETFSKYKNCFRGKKVVILGSGPTLNYYTPMPDAIHVGLNRIFQHETIPIDYLFAADYNAEMYSDMEKVRNRVKHKVFFCRAVNRYFGRSLLFPESFFEDEKMEQIFMHHSKGFTGWVIPHDMCNHFIPIFATIAFIAFQFALYTCPKELYLVGLDTVPTGHFFYGSEDNTPVNNGLFMHIVKPSYSRMKMFARLHYPDTEIISINPVGLKGLFKDVYTDEYLASLDNEQN